VAGRNTVLVDDFTLATSTLAEAADRVMAAGTGSVMATVTLGVFAECSMERLDASPIDKLLVTDTVENSRVPLSSKVQTISAPRCSRRRSAVYLSLSISELFAEGARRAVVRAGAAPRQA
jgi:ribose-phosphate pyrophosphokinase